MSKLINLLSLLKWLYETIAAGYRLFLKKEEKEKTQEAEDLKEDIKNAESEDDFRDAADRLSKLRKR